MWTLIILCIFATSKFVGTGNLSCPCVALRAFFMPENVHNMRRLTPCICCNSIHKPVLRTLTAGSGRRFFCPHVKKLVQK